MSRIGRSPIPVPSGVSVQLDGPRVTVTGPRGTLALDRASRAHAWLDGRGAVMPDDVKAVAHACLRHRLILSYEAEAEGIVKDKVLDEVLTQVAVA